MIIDSHAHYNHGMFQNTLRYLTLENGSYGLKEGDREQLLQELLEANVLCSVEPGIHLQSCEEIMALAGAYPGRIFPAMGVHPTRAIHEKWRDRKRLAQLTAREGVVAVGECGLDYHYKREEQHRLKQHFWFLYQLDLAKKRKKPVILHVRDAHRDALRILKRHPAGKLGGVMHCFQGNPCFAEQYVKLGYHLGIGAAILQPEERAGELWAAVVQTPLERILIETDAPFILPYCKDVIPSKVLRRTRNTSLILPRVIEKIAELKCISPEEVERVTAENAIRLFSLPVKL